MTAPAAGSLPALLAEIPDLRGHQGLRHPIAATLAKTVCGILTGAQGCEAIAQWVCNQYRAIWHALGFRRKPPCANMYRKLLRRLPAKALETTIARWKKDLVPDPLPKDSLQGVSLDGKTLCGTLDKHAQNADRLKAGLVRGSSENSGVWEESVSARGCASVKRCLIKRLSNSEYFPRKSGGVGVSRNWTLGSLAGHWFRRKWLPGRELRPVTRR